MPKVFLHIGTMKTGTTSIQSSLAQNPTVLEQNNLAYLGWPLRHSNFIEKRIAEIANPKSDIIISDEGLWHFAFSQRSDTLRIAELLSAYDVKVIVYLRRIDSFLESWFLQGLKNGTGAKSLSDFVLKAPSRKDVQFVDQIERFEDLFGKGCIKVRPFESAQLERHDVVSDFARQVGLDPSKLVIDEPANVTPRPSHLLLKEVVRQSMRTKSDETEILVDDLLNELIANGYSDDTQRLLVRSEAERLCELFQPIYAEIQRRWGGGAAPNFFKDWDGVSRYSEEMCEIRKLQERIAAKAAA